MTAGDPVPCGATCLSDSHCAPRTNSACHEKLFNYDRVNKTDILMTAQPWCSGNQCVFCPAGYHEVCTGPFQKTRCSNGQVSSACCSDGDCTDGTCDTSVNRCVRENWSCCVSDPAYAEGNICLWGRGEQSIPAEKQLRQTCMVDVVFGVWFSASVESSIKQHHRVKFVGCLGATAYWSCLGGYSVK